MKAILLVIGGWLTLSTLAYANDVVTECDRLTSHPEDPDRIAPGVEDVKDLKAAIAVCEADVKKDTENRRLRYQLARVYFYSQQTDKAMPHLEFAANAGAQQAQFVLGYITDEGLQGVKRDACKVEGLWYKSANQGRFAALVSYPHHVINNKFSGCKIQATTSEIDAYLAKAKETAKGYYQTLLVSALIADYQRFKAGK